MPGNGDVVASASSDNSYLPNHPGSEEVTQKTYLENRPRCGWPPQDESSAAFKGTQGLNGYFVL